MYNTSDFGLQYTVSRNNLKAIYLPLLYPSFRLSGVGLSLRSRTKSGEWEINLLRSVWLECYGL